MRTNGRHDDASPVIVTEGLTKRYGDVAALTDVNLTVPPGVIFGFLGPNGAGKTTAIRLLLGFIKPTAGRARIFGHETWRESLAARRELGYLVQSDALYSDMSGHALLEFTARLSAKPPVLRATLVDTFDLPAEALRRQIGTYSKGMRQKLALIAAMQHDPALLILDEPTDGLDPLIHYRFTACLRELRDRGRTIFMSSHDLTEVERICEDVAVVRDGRLIAQESIEAMKQRHRRSAEITFRDEPPPDLAAVPHVSAVTWQGRRATLAIEGDLNPLLQFLARHQIADLTLTPPRLEDIFLTFYGEQGDDRSGPPVIKPAPAEPAPVERR